MLIDPDNELKKYKKGKFWPKVLLYSFGFMVPIAFVIGPGTALLISPFLAWPLAKMRLNSQAEFFLGLATKMQAIMMEKALGNPQAPAYFCMDFAWLPSAIAADPNTNTVTAVCWSGPTTPKRFKELPDGCFVSHTFKSSELVKWRAVDPGANTIEALGSLANVSTSDMMSMAMKNSAARQEQRKNTGLTLETNRLDLQEVFLNLTYESAKQWILLLKKLSDGELPMLNVATEFPKPITKS